MSEESSSKSIKRVREDAKAILQALAAPAGPSAEQLELEREKLSLKRERFKLEMEARKAEAEERTEQMKLMASTQQMLATLIGELVKPKNTQ